MLDNKSEQDAKKPIGIVGMGPGGIIAAIEAAEKGHPVFLVENRDHFTRTQRVKLSMASIVYLLSLNKREVSKGKKLDPLDEEFIRRLGEEQTVPVNLLQEFLERKLKNMYGAQTTIKRGHEHQVKGIDVNTSTLEIESNGQTQNITCSHIVGADGARHEMANKITEAANQSNGEFKIDYKQLELQTRQVAHGTVALRYKDEYMSQASSEAMFPRMLSENALPLLAELGWDEPYLPKCYIFFDEENQHFYYAGEIPQSILDQADKTLQREQLAAWGKLILKLQYQILEEQTELDILDEADEKSQKINELRTTAFPVTLTYSETPCVALPSKNAFALVGDASKNANFLFGHGANDAIKDGRKFAECLREDGSFDIDSYQQHQREQKQQMIKQMQSDKQSMQSVYKGRIEELDQEIIKQAKILIELAIAYADDIEVNAAAKECKKLINQQDLDYDKIYDSTIKLADIINNKSKERFVTEQQDFSGKLSRKQHKLQIKKEKLEKTRHYTQSTLFKAVSFLSSHLAKYLEKRNELAQEKLAERISQITAKTDFLQKRTVEEMDKLQKDIVQPHLYKAHKEKLSHMVKENNEKPATKDSPLSSKKKEGP